jgi:tetraacyldisaccharide 4'-kinase
VVLDDGFQHEKLHRELNILMACPEDLNPLTRLLPAGPLREPAAQSRRAHLIAGFEPDWRESQTKPSLLFEYQPTCLVLPSRQILELKSHAGAKVHLLSAIARPERFRQTAKQAGFEVKGFSTFRDHHRFKPGELGEVEIQAKARGAEAILTTEKDLARMTGMELDFPLWALRIELVIRVGFDLLFSKITDVLTPGDGR